MYTGFHPNVVGYCRAEGEDEIFLNNSRNSGEDSLASSKRFLPTGVSGHRSLCGGIKFHSMQKILL
jgi:hypothetical protein